MFGLSLYRFFVPDTKGGGEERKHARTVCSRCGGWKGLVLLPTVNCQLSTE